MDWSHVLTVAFLGNVLAASVRLATPLIFAALGETYAERSGVFNLGVEGIMLLCGLVGFAGAYATNNLWAGVIAAALAGALLGLLYAFVTVTLRADQIVAGFALLLISTGGAIYFNRLLFPSRGGTQPQIASFAVSPVPLLHDIPVLGPILFNHTALTYLMLACVLLSVVVLYRTRFGLRVSAVGEYPQAADSVGINVAFTRYACVVIGAAFAGVAGAYFSLVDLGFYVDTMVGGRGFIALALVVFGQWNPLLVLLGGLLFGAVEAIQQRFQILGSTIPAQFMIMMPYLLTIIVQLVGRKRRAPGALTVPYARE
jgi:general nucleoside transport system permease protein